MSRIKHSTVEIIAPTQGAVVAAEPRTGAPVQATWWQSELPVLKELQPQQAHAAGGRLVFAMDATGSRSASWSQALVAQTAMFEAVATHGGLSVQLVHFGGNGFNASKWVRDARQLSDIMHGVSCVCGGTQIGNVLEHVVGETRKNPVAALVYVGDAQEERLSTLSALASRLSGLGVRGFFVQDGSEPSVEEDFRRLATTMKGAYAHLGPNAAADLKSFLSAVAVYASGGTSALTALAARDSGAQKLLLQMR
jgi:hypothetical protein